MCDEIVVRVLCVQNKITCALKLDYSEEEVRSVILNHSRRRPNPTAPRCRKTQVKASGVGFGCHG